MDFTGESGAGHRQPAAPLHKLRRLRRTPFYRVFAAVYTCGLVALFYHHTQTLLHSTNLVISLSLLFSDLVLAFMWLGGQSFRMIPVRRREHPENLGSVVSRSGFPGLDVFICTADPDKEPPMSAVNTALSAMGFDYPAEKVSVYLSDDGGSELTLFAFMEAAQFAAHWLPFCRDNNIVERSPQAYFTEVQPWCPNMEKIKGMYESMKVKVEDAVNAGRIPDKFMIQQRHRQAFKTWTDHGSSFTRFDHPTIVQVGFRYGALVEDFFTGYQLHCEGWKTIFCDPERPAFYGDIPINLNDVLNQIKRWVLGGLEVAFSRYCPLTFGVRELGPLMALSYGFYAFWSLWCVPVLIYAFFPQLTLLNGVHILPKVSEPWFMLYMFLFLGAYGQNYLDFALAGGTLKRWWSDQRMWMIRGISTCLFGSVEFLLKSLRISTVGFNVTCKVVDNEQSKRYKQGIFEFGVHSPMFVPLVMAATLNLFSFLWGLKLVFGDQRSELVAQLLVSGFVVLNCFPVYEAMLLRTDKGKMPVKTSMVSIVLVLAVCKAAALALGN